MSSNYVNIGKAESICDQSRSNLSAIALALLIGDDSISDFDGSISRWPLETAGAYNLTSWLKDSGKAVHPRIG